MKKSILFSFFLLCGIAMSAQQVIHFHLGSDISSYTLAESDSIYFDDTHTTLYFDNTGTTVNFVVADIDSITFTTEASLNVSIAWQGSSVVIDNPLSGSGVEVTQNGSDVTVVSTSTLADINYILSGNSTDGSFKIYSDRRFNLLLNDLGLSNTDGPAINIQSDKKATIHLLSGSNNTIADGATYSAAPVVNGITEDQKAAFFSESQLEFIGGGAVNISASGSDAHALASDDEVDIRQGQINILTSVKDGIHGTEGFYMRGGQVLVTGSGDGIDSESGALEISCGEITIESLSNDVKAMNCDSIITITGGSIALTIGGDQSKGIKSAEGIQISGGSIDAACSGDAVLVPATTGSDPSYPSLITSDGDISISGGSIILQTSGKGGRGISGNANVLITGGSISVESSGNGATYTNTSGATDAYHSTCLRTDGNLVINGGEVSLSNSGSGGKGIDSDGDITIGDGSSEPMVEVTTTGNSITITSGGGGGGPGGGGNNGTYDECKTIKADGEVTINSGNITIESANDGIKSASFVTINNGTLNILDSYEAIESPFITINNGEILLTSTDDGFNATHGTGGESSDGSMLTINGGNIAVDASGGDAVDSNGNVTITGGVIAVHGPQSSPEVGMDYNGTALISGGFIVISGTNSNMTQGFSASSSQRSLTMKTTSSISANTIIHVEDSNGNEVFTFKPKRSYYSCVFSSPVLTNGTSYSIYTGGSSSGSVSNGLYSGGTYTGGTFEQSFTVNGIVTTVNF